MRIPFRVVPSRYRENWFPTRSPEITVMRHAAGKVRCAAVPRGARFILGADTLVWFQGKLWGKPRTKKEARQMLTRLSGRRHDVYTGVALLDLKTGRLGTGYARTRVYLRRLTKKALVTYHEVVFPLDKAGSYAIQEKPKVVKRIEGSYSNVMGLPREIVKRMVDRIGWRA